MNVKYCQICGAELSETAKFCNQCGAKVIDLREASPAEKGVVPQAVKPEEKEPGYNFGEPADEDKTTSTPDQALGEERNHGGCLSTFLILAMLANLGFGILTLLMADDLGELALVSALLNFAGFGFAIAVWKWKKWGVYGYIGVIGITALINLSTGYFAGAAQGIIPIVALSLLVRPVWGQMD